MSREIPIQNPPLSSEEVLAFSRLNQTEVASIDEAILSCALARWQKVAMMVCLSMEKLQSRYPQFSEIFYGERIRTLAEEGRLDSQGDLSYMRFSEVRLPGEN